VGRPRLDAVEDVDGASPRGARGGVGRLPAEHLAVHGLEVDDGHGERAVHVEHGASQRPPPLGRGGGRGEHGPAGEAEAPGKRRGGEGAVGGGEQAWVHTWRDRGRWIGRARENGGRSGGAAAVVVQQLPHLLPHLQNRENTIYLFNKFRISSPIPRDRISVIHVLLLHDRPANPSKPHGGWSLVRGGGQTGEARERQRRWTELETGGAREGQPELTTGGGGDRRLTI
jgi:hypothetical protein